MEVEEAGVTRSNSEPEPEPEPRPPFALVGGGAAAEEAGAEEVSNKLIISSAADRFGAGAADAWDEAEVAGADMSLLEPKISARRSCVDGPVERLAEAEEDGARSSPPMRSTTSLSVRVDPTGFLSLTAGQRVSTPQDA